MGFTQIPNWLLDSTNGLTSAEFRVLMCIYRLTVGFHRKTYKISYSQLTEMSGVKSISIVCQSLKRQGHIDFECEIGKASVITILKPITSVNRFPKKAINSVNHTHSVSEPHPLTHLNGSRGAKENYKENLKKDLFLEFKKKYPEDKFDDATSFDAWQSLTDADKQLVVGVMEYQNNGWADIDNKYIPKASNYLLKRKFLDDTVLEPYESEIRREKAKIEQREYYQKAEQDSATPEEIKAILENALKPIDKQRNNNGKG
jgi:hypothetical protein